MAKKWYDFFLRRKKQGKRSFDGAQNSRLLNDFVGSSRSADDILKTDLTFDLKS